MLNSISEASLLATIGVFGGIILGLAARLGRFCTLGAIEDFLYQNSTMRLRMWLLAIGIAGLGSFTLVWLGLLVPSETLYYQAPWAPLPAILGGLLFGYGMALAGNCGFGALARLGGGDLRSFVIALVMGISAYMVLSGPLAGFRLEVLARSEIKTQIYSYPDLFQKALGVNNISMGFLLSGILTLAALWSTEFLKKTRMLLTGSAVGLAIVSGWAGTQWLANHGFGGSSVQSHTFTSPVGETLIYVMTSSGGGLTFGVGSVFGVLIGAFLGSLIKGHFRWEACEDPRELKRQVAGATLMGIGAVFALGCTIGQGVSAFSLWTINAPIVFICIFAGAALGLRQLITGFTPVFSD